MRVSKPSPPRVAEMHRRVLAHVGAEPAREARERRADQARIGLAVLGAERRADHVGAEPRQLARSALRAEQLEAQAVLARRRAHSARAAAMSASERASLR